MPPSSSLCLHPLDKAFYSGELPPNSAETRAVEKKEKQGPAWVLQLERPFLWVASARHVVLAPSAPTPSAGVCHHHGLVHQRSPPQPQLFPDHHQPFFCEHCSRSTSCAGAIRSLSIEVILGDTRNRSPACRHAHFDIQAAAVRARSLLSSACILAAKDMSRATIPRGSTILRRRRQWGPLPPASSRWATS